VASEERAGNGENGRGQLRYRIAFVLTAAVLVILIATLPLSVASLLDDLVGPATGRVIQVTDPDAPALPEHTRLHAAAIALDELQLEMTFRVSGNFVCAPDCAARHRLIFVSIAPDDDQAEGLPPSVAINMPAAGEAFSSTIQLPVRGFPIHYPFDSYETTIGIALQRVLPDGKAETLTPQQAKGHLFLSLQELLPRQTMLKPVPVDPASVRGPGDPLTYVEAFHIVFERPGYVRVLAILLVSLVAAAAAYTVFLRSLQDLVVNSGALVLGVWGIRAILTPGNIYYLTAVDLALSVVIIFLLGGIAVRALIYMHDRAELRLLRRDRGTRNDEPPAAQR
jgi:hypothetical protein